MKKALIKSLAIVLVFAFGFLMAPETMAKKEEKGKVPDQYIVVFKKGIESESTTEEIVSSHGLGRLFTYKNVIKGFAANISKDKLEKIKKDPRVDFVVEDKVFEADGELATAYSSQKVPTGINRISAFGLANTGSGIGVAVIDSGISTTHYDLKANIAGGVNCVTDSRTKSYNDDNGHGTHVAGVIAALNNGIGVVGVAPKAKVLAVKVLNSKASGTTSSLICGIDWVTANASKYNIKVANMSIHGFGQSDNDCGKTNNDVLHQAICRSRDLGIAYVAAAGNGDANGNPLDASTQVPAAYNDAVIAVSSLVDTDGKSGGLGNSTSYGADDSFASNSNYSPTVIDLGAPGVNIYSTYKSRTYATMSGTSMATPHVSGAAALYLAKNPGTVFNQNTFNIVKNALRAIGEAGAPHHISTVNHPEPIVIANQL